MNSSTVNKLMFLPQFFEKVEDSGINQLRSFVHELTSTRRVQGAENAIHELASHTLEMQAYLSDTGTQVSE